jgi:hypothetical protein
MSEDNIETGTAAALNESADVLPGPDALPGVPLPASAAPVPLSRWIAGGWRAGIFLDPRAPGDPPSAWQLLLIAVLASAVDVCAARLEVAGPAVFESHAWLSSWWTTGVAAWLVWWAFAGTPARKGPVATWFALWFTAALPAALVSHALAVAQAHDALPAVMSANAWLAWGVYLGLWAWSLGVAATLARRLGAPGVRTAVLLLALAALFGVSEWQFRDRWWRADESQAEQAPVLHLSQETFEAQQVLLGQTLDAIAPQRPGVRSVYGLVFAPYGAEDVFLRESTLVSQLLRERFDATGRVVQLVNHATTAQTYPWATPLNLQRAINAIAARMDRDNDVLVVYLTSHGASNFQLAADNGALEVPWLTPQQLRDALDGAGIRNRVIAISACFSGGWVEPLAGDTTLVMTAADATHTSYGCGRLSELTFFGRAMWSEQLRKTHSFSQAFAQAVPVIRQREIEAGKSDGFSNPQIRMGKVIAPMLDALAKRLDGQSP